MSQQRAESVVEGRPGMEAKPSCDADWNLQTRRAFGPKARNERKGGSLVSNQREIV